MSLEGDLTSLALPRVLTSIAASRQSGILTVQGEDDIVAVSFLEGRIVAADALNQTVEEGLAEVLESSGLVAPQDLEAALREHQGGGSGSLGDLLTSRGLIGRDELLDSLRMQTYRLLLQLLTWNHGEFKFYDGDEVSYEEGLTPITVEELLIRSIGDLGGKGGITGPVPELGSIYRAVPSPAAVMVLGRDGDGAGGGVWISPAADALLAAVDGETTAAELATRLDLGRYPALQALHDLTHHGLVEDLGPPRPDLDALELDKPEPASAELRAEIFMPPEPGAAPAVAPPAVAPPAVAPPAVAPPAVAPPAVTDAPEAPEPTAAPPGPPITDEFELGTLPAAQTAESGVLTPPESGVLTPPESGAPQPAAAAPATAPTIPVAPAAPAARDREAAAGRLLGPGLALLLAAGLALVLARTPRAYLLPFPWQDFQRSGIERQLRQSLYLKLDRAAKTYFHLEGHYPEDLEELVDRGLLLPQDLRDQAGLELAYSTTDGSYQVDPLAAGEPLLGQGSTEAITGDFLLDPQFDNPLATDVSPLYLID